MIQILPVRDRSLLDKLNRSYRQEASYAYVYIEKREIKASCLYDLKGDTCYIRNVSTLEPDIFDGLVRAVFANALDRGINKGEFDSAVDHKMLKTLGFVQDDGFLVHSFTKIIHMCGNCAHES